MVRASACHAEGRGFESRRSRQGIRKLTETGHATAALEPIASRRTIRMVWRLRAREPPNRSAKSRAPIQHLEMGSPTTLINAAQR